MSAETKPNDVKPTDATTPKTEAPKAEVKAEAPKAEVKTEAPKPHAEGHSHDGHSHSHEGHSHDGHSHDGHSHDHAHPHTHDADPSRINSQESKVKIDDAGDDEAMPELEPTVSAAAGEDSGAGGAGRGKHVQSRSEKKARKAVQKLGMKAVPGIMQVTVKQNKKQSFVITYPDVYKNTAETTWVIFGKIEEHAANQQALEKMAQQFAASNDLSGNPDEPPELVPSGTTPTPAVSDISAEAPDDAPGDGGVNPKHVDLVLEQVNCTRAQAIKALKESNNDIVNAIMKLSMS